MAEVEGIVSSVAVRLKLETADLENKVNNTMVEFKRLGSQINDVAAGMAAMGVAGVGLFGGLLAFMPKTQTTLGLMELDWIKLGKVLDDNIQPKVQFLADTFKDLVAIIAQNEALQELIAIFLVGAPLALGLAGVIKLLGLLKGSLIAIGGIAASPAIIALVGFSAAGVAFNEAYETLKKINKQLGLLEGFTGNSLIDIILLWKLDLDAVVKLANKLLGIFESWDDLTLTNISEALEAVGDAIKAISKNWDDFATEHPLFAGAYTLVTNPIAAGFGAAQAVNNYITMNVTTGDINNQGDADVLTDSILEKLADKYSSDGGTTA